jgi:hypothetical protein
MVHWGQTFKRNVSFTLTRFGGDARFDAAKCVGTAWFTGASFVGAVRADEPSFVHELVGLLPVSTSPPALTGAEAETSP